MLQLETTIISLDNMLYQKEPLQHLQELVLEVLVFQQVLPQMLVAPLMVTIWVLPVLQQELDGILQQDILLLRSYKNV